MGRSTFLLGSNLAAGQSIAVDINGNVRILNLGEKALPSEIIMSPSNLGEMMEHSIPMFKLVKLLQMVVVLILPTM
ncbi:hypothetical protein [Vibrio aestuarianus]|uniref:hypothetical protein n=1 Tax=Vibrio aestuarianus TaxID=28171 RepID=UPI00237D18FC|nr:hypothetical protein [Vibrio aestuarianus]MDE1209010.1 hypothetical protein [Vibrio aestuarianus]